MFFEIVFWLSFGILFFAYFGFFCTLTLVAKVKTKPVNKHEYLPSVSIVICAYNEEKNIQKKIENCMELDYPKDKMEIIVVSDGSTDGTNDLLREIKNPLVKVHVQNERMGKTASQNTAVSLSKSEVIFFTDATVTHPPNALKYLLQSLYDPSVGCVTGKPIFKQDAGLTSIGVSKQDQYELYLRKKLGEIHSLFGAQDCIYAIPRKLYCPVRRDLDSGFVGPLKILENGYRTVYEPEALAYVDRQAPNAHDEFIRRARIVLRGMRGLLHMKQLMNPFKYGFLAISLVSTRLLRWLTPVFLLSLLFSNLFLLEYPFYLVIACGQVGFYLIAFGAFVLEKMGYNMVQICCIPLYFCLLTCSASLGLLQLVTGKSGQLWETRR